ncbi:MAG TPA: hypothetical protein QGF58_14870 [Myxococcota bacterium]|nr:hypothetical protein [Myxococcota bacterium]
MAERTLIEQLESKNIHDRADAGRQLSKCGVPQDIPRLLEAAFDDSSPGVRLYAVGAAADILSRYRVGPSAAELDEISRMRIFHSFRSIDPGDNAGMFSVMANLGVPRVAKRILVGVQDPRLDVRTGALVGIYRYFVSSSAAGDDEMRARVQELIASGRLRPDAQAALVRLCAQCGWQESRELLRAQLTRGDQAAVAAQQSLDRLEFSASCESVVGVWVSYGTDGGEIPATDGPWTWLVLYDGVGLIVGVDRIRAFRWTCGDPDRLDIDGEKPWALRRMVLDEPRSRDFVPAIQVEANTWFRTDDKELMTAAEYLLERSEALAPAWRAAVAEIFVPRIPETANGTRLIARVELAAGRVDAANARLEAVCKKKGAPADAWFYLGEARAALGDAEGAREAWAKCAEKATKRNPLRATAEDRLA